MPTRQAVTIVVQPWFKDHCFNGRVLLPAVEIMLILAEFVQKAFPDFSVQNMKDASFAKFLEIPENCEELPAFIEYEEVSNNEICTRLLSRIQLKKMSRMKVHAELTFINSHRHTAEVPSVTFPQDAPTATSIETKRIYQELVPFGPAYHSLIETLYISNQSAKGRLQAPNLPATQSVQKHLGSPFPLDGAMHAACVLGQCTASFVPFPIGFEQRVIHKATLAGKKYKIEVHTIAQTEDELICNLFIFDNDEQLCETIKNLRMRDVSGGEIEPPQWVQNCLA